MGTVIDLQAGDGGGLETADDRLDGQYLLDGPLHSYLGDSETPAFALLNKRNGVTIEREDGTETYKPVRSCRTLVAITDVRLLIAVGGAGENGDRVISVPLSTIEVIDADRSLLGGALRVVTESGETWSIGCRGDLTPVVDYLERAERAWSRAERFTAEVDNRLEAATEHLESGEYDAALDATDDAMSVIAHSTDQLRSFEMGPGVIANAGFDRQRERIAELRRRSHAEIAADYRTLAQGEWQTGRYRDAHEHLVAAQQALERALATDASTPSDEELSDRRSETERELENLRRAPGSAAELALTNAREVEDPVERAEKLEEALARYRDVLGLCWGPDSNFEGDPEQIQTRILTVVDELLAARTDAVQRSLIAADRLTARDRDDQALAECDRADDHLDAARAVVAELAPAHRETVSIWQTTIDEQRHRIETRETASGDETVASTESDSPAVAEPSVESGGEQSGGAEGTDGQSPAAGDEDKTRAREATVEEIPPTAFEFDANQSGSASAEQPAERPPTDTDDRGGIQASRLEALDQAAFTELVAELWGAQGWETTAFTASADQYDVMATRSEPVEIRVLVWAVHRPGEPLAETVVDRCATDRSQVDRADVAAVVTTGTVPEAVRERASEHNVKLLDRSALLELLEQADMPDRLEERIG